MHLTLEYDEIFPTTEKSQISEQITSDLQLTQQYLLQIYRIFSMDAVMNSHVQGDLEFLANRAS